MRWLARAPCTRRFFSKHSSSTAGCTATDGSVCQLVIFISCAPPQPNSAAAVSEERNDRISTGYLWETVDPERPIDGYLALWRPKGAITSKMKHAIKHKTSPARLAQLFHNCCSPGRYAVIGCKLKQNANEGCNSNVVQVLQDLFYVLLHVLFYLWSLLKGIVRSGCYDVPVCCSAVACSKP